MLKDYKMKNNNDIKNDSEFNFMKRFRRLQSLVEIPKTDPVGVNKEFVKYKYRNNEDILKSANKIIDDYKLDLIILQSETVIMLGGRYYITSCSKVVDILSTCCLESSTSVHEGDVRVNARGQQMMDNAQYSGACVSYARKYSLCGLLAIDDGFDNDDIAHEPNNNNYSDAKVQNAVPVAKTPTISQSRKEINVKLVEKKTSKKGNTYYQIYDISDQKYTTFDTKIEEVAKGGIILADVKITDKNGMSFSSLSNIQTNVSTEELPDPEIPF